MADKPTTTEAVPDERTTQQLLLDIYGRICRLEGIVDTYLSLMERRLDAHGTEADPSRRDDAG
jgi:hypothetical protein